MTILAKTLHGSRMYGLDNPASDYDHKAIHLPPQGDCLLLRASRNMHTKDVGPDGLKIEAESFALQEFLALAARAEDVAITTLHVPEEHILVDSPTFRYLRENRNRFYTKRMAGQMGYCRGMAAKYALRADRMETVEGVITILEAMQEHGVVRLGQAWDLLVDLPHTRKFENPADRGIDKRMYEVTGKGLPATITPAYGLDILYKLRDSYGERVRTARGMGNADLKAVSHSFRVAYQLKHLYQEGGFSFPLPESPFIRDVKEGRLNYVGDGLDARLNDLITEVEALSEASAYPDTVDTAWCDRLVLDTYASIPADSP